MTLSFPLDNGQARIFVIIPALDEESAISRVIDEIPDYVDEIVVVDNGSTDGTADIAREHGATVLSEPRRGYGYACLAGIRYVSSLTGHGCDPGDSPRLESGDIVLVFLDGDHSDYPGKMGRLLRPVIREGCDLVIGSRIMGDIDENAMPAHAALANRFVGMFLSSLLGERVTDLGPFRAVKLESLLSLDMEEKRYGWTVEMIIKAKQKGLSIREIPVNYRKRIGRSKVSGSAVESIKAMFFILYCTLKYIIRIR